MQLIVNAEQEVVLLDIDLGLLVLHETRMFVNCGSPILTSVVH